MAEQIISPGVFTKENDLSFLPQGIEAIGAAVVGPTVKGPAFHPTIVRSFSEYERKFGPLSKDTFVPQKVREYIRSAGAVTVVRVLAGGGWTFTAGTNEPIALCAGGAATAIDALDTTGWSGDSVFTITIPANAGGSGTAVTITVDADKTGAPVGEGANAIAIGAEDLTVAQLADALIAAINGTSITAENYNGNGNVIQFATSGDGQAIAANATDGGIIGVTAAEGSSANKITLTVDRGGTNGNSAAIAESSGYDLVDVTAFTGGDSNVLMGVLFPSMAASGNPTIHASTLSSGSQVNTDFSIGIKKNSENIVNYSASLNPSNNNYLFKQLGYKPTVSKNGAVSYGGTPAYSYIEFKSLLSSTIAATASPVTGYLGLIASASITLTDVGSSNVTFNGNQGYTEGYSWASTPTITSGFLDPGINSTKTTKELFQFHTLAHGTSTNKEYKITISNIREIADIDGEEQYTTFTVQVRKYGDKDKSPNVLETFNGCNLNPDSPNYIARKIGDRYSHYNTDLGKMETIGSFNNLSQYIRVSVNDAVAEGSTSPKLRPSGFKAVSNPIASTVWSNEAAFPSASYEGTQTIGGNYSSKATLGWKFDDKETDNANFLLPVDSTQQANVSGEFNLDNYSGHASSGLMTGSLSASIDETGAVGPASSQLKFSVPFQGGDDGLAPWTPKFTGAETTLDTTSYTQGTNLYGFDLSSTSVAGYTAYKKALDILENQDEWDINMLALPGVIKQYHSNVTQAGIDMVEERGDAFYVMDLASKDATVNKAVSEVSGIDSNYTGTYYPWVKVQGETKPVFVPPSVIVPGAIAKSDQIGQGEWFAPAGLNRGVLGSVIEARVRLNQSERDRLYKEKINPIASFPGVSNPVIWGQKTLQSRSTALDRINVRRLLIAVKKFIASSSKFLVFEQNTAKTRQRFLNIVNPYLEGIQQRQGLFAFRVQMDGSNNTPDVIDRNQLVGGIFLQPTKTAEFIVLDFNILPTGATFDA